MALQRESIIREAVTLLDDVGFDGLTVRRLAERLGVQNPALYWHFKNKQEVLNGMASVMLAEAFNNLVPPAHREDWAVWLVDVARRLRRVFLDHRDGARVIAGANLTESVLPMVLEVIIHVLEEAGLDFSAAQVSTITLFNYTLGAAFEEQTEPLYLGTQPSRGPQDISRLLYIHRVVTSTEAPPEVTNAIIRDRTSGFEAGLRLILAGIQSLQRSSDGV